MNLSPLQNLASSVLPIVLIVVVCYLAWLVIKGHIGKFAGILGCAFLAACAVAALANYQTTGPKILALVGL